MAGEDPAAQYEDKRDVNEEVLIVLDEGGGRGVLLDGLIACGGMVPGPAAVAELLRSALAEAEKSKLLSNGVLLAIAARDVAEIGGGRSGAAAVEVCLIVVACVPGAGAFAERAGREYCARVDEVVDAAVGRAARRGEETVTIFTAPDFEGERAAVGDAADG